MVALAEARKLLIGLSVGPAGWFAGVDLLDASRPEAPRYLATVRVGEAQSVAFHGSWLLAGTWSEKALAVIDVRDPERPRPAGWYRLPVKRATGDPSPAAGLAVVGGRAFVAGAFDDLHLVETGIVDADSPQVETALQAPMPDVVPPPEWPRYRSEGSIRAVLPWRDDRLLVAAGSDGLHVVRADAEGFSAVAVYPADGFVRDVAAHGDRVYAAESLGGLSVWKRKADGTLERLGGYEVPGRSIHQVVLADEGRVGFLAVGGNTLHVVRLATDGSCERLLETTPASGLFYREPIAPVHADGRRVRVQWHSIGLVEYVAENGAVRPSGYRFSHAMDTECGVAPWRDGWLATSRSGLFVLGPEEQRSPNDIGRRVVAGRTRPGKPTVDGEIAYIADPFLGRVSAIRLAQGSEPQLVGELQLSGHPGRVRPFRGKVLVPAGRDGLLLWDVRRPGLGH
jgi:hypothetical protein